MTGYRKLVALGSSFAAGPGIEPVENADAMRSARNYAHLLASHLGARLQDLSVSAATTSTILDVPQLTMAGVEFPPQISGMDADADLVTVTAGGNDLQFVGSMLYAAWTRFQPDSPITAMLSGDFEDGIPEPTDERIEAVAEGLARIVREARVRAPGARVVLVDYLTVIDETAVADSAHFSDTETRTFLRMQRALARGFALAAERSGAELLTASELSVGHGLGSLDPWVFDFQTSLDMLGASFHPNERGMAVIAEALAAALETTQASQA